MSHAIEIKNLSKTYQSNGKSPLKQALKSVDLTIPRGMIYGLLGPNGAGKSTLINILAGLVLKTDGNVKIWGTDLDENPRQCRANIGIVPQELNFDPFFSPQKLLDIQAGLYGVPRAERRSAELLKLVGLEDKGHNFTRALSGGMRRRLMIAKAMVHNPPILVLDEPTAGVDIELRRQLWDNVRGLNRQGMTVLLTTHYLEEAEELCERIAIINGGEIVADEEKETLLARVDRKELTVTLSNEISEIPKTLDRFTPRKDGQRTLTLTYAPKETKAGEIISLIQAQNWEIQDISSNQSALEDVFLQLTKSTAHAVI